MDHKAVDEYNSEKILSKYLNVVSSNQYDLHTFNKLDFKGKYPIFIKIISDNAVHKVKSNALFFVVSEKDFNKKKNNILLRARELKSNSIVIQEKVYGKEFIVGIKDDPKFGKLIMLGIGGKLAEQLKDVSFRSLPITKEDFYSMLDDLNNQAMISNLNKDKFWNFIEKLIVFVNNSGKKYSFIDLNPVIIDSDTKNPIVVDARLYIKAK